MYIFSFIIFNLLSSFQYELVGRPGWTKKLKGYIPITIGSIPFKKPEKKENKEQKEDNKDKDSISSSSTGSTPKEILSPATE